MKNIFLFLIFAFFTFNSFAQSKQSLGVDTLKIGDSASVHNPTIEMAGTNVKLRANKSSGFAEFTNDGSLWKKFGSGSGSGSGGINILANNSFEDGLGSWTSSGGTFSQQTFTNSVEGNTKYAQFISTTTGQYFESSLTAVPDSLGLGCQANIGSYATATDSAFKISAIDSSSNVLSTYTLPSSGGASVFMKSYTISFPCPSAGTTIKIRIESLLAATFKADLLYLGGNQNTVSVPCQGTAACEDKFSAQVTTTSGAVTNENLEFITGNCTAANPTVCTLSGFTVIPNCNVSVNAASPSAVHITAISSSSVTVESFTTTTGANVASIPFTLSCQKQGVDFSNARPQAAVTSEQSAWFIDANIGGANPVGTATTSYLPFENSALDLVLNTGSANVEIPCSSTNASTGLTCSSGNEQVGVAFNPPYAGAFEACIQTGLYNNGSGTSAVQWVETSNNSQTIIQEGKSRTHFSGLDNISTTLNNCGTFTFSDVAKKTLRFSYESGATNLIMYADRSSSVGQRDIKITVRPLTMNIARPVLTGDQVTTPSVSNPEIFSFRFGAAISTSCTSSPCAYLEQTGNKVSSVTRSAAGSFNYNFTKTFSKIRCVGAGHNPGVAAAFQGPAAGSNTNTVGPQWFQANGTGSDVYADVICHGY